MKQECNCLESIKKMIIEKQESVGHKMLEGDFSDISIYPVKRLYINFNLKYSFKKVDGSESKPKNEKINIFFSYCPFCGKKYPE